MYYIVVSGTFFIFLIVGGIVKTIHNNHCNIICVKATIIEKENLSRYISTYNITFKLENNKTKTFEVPLQDYIMCNKNSIGILKYQGDSYISFVLIK